jgi:rare lipoprotein A
MAWRRLRVGLVLSALLAGGCAARVEPPPPPPAPIAIPAPAPPARIFEQTGRASWYGTFHHGRQTASGEIFDMNDLTAAHRALPLGTVARVTNLENGRTVTVKINDRGPYKAGRIIDLSKRAAEDLGMKEQGLARVRIEVFENAQAGDDRPAR